MPSGPSVSGNRDNGQESDSPVLLDSSGETSPPLKDGGTEGDVANRKRRLMILLGILAVCIVALALGLGLGLGLNHGSDDDNVGPVIDLGYASYRGSYLDNGISQFLGMRYAEPPVGDLRWRAPVDPETEEGIQKAKKVSRAPDFKGWLTPNVSSLLQEPLVDPSRQFGPICIGISDILKDTVDEDCLFVNVWGPTNATADMKLPVMVFIQGGGYTRNANANWNGTRLVETSGKDLVYVNFNYRVGLWGFLAGEDVRADGDLNVGMLDQRFLLQWVQKHIHNFGGDPDHVVIQGVSAGAGSAALHLIAYGGHDDGLFVGAIAESTFIPTHPPVSELEYQFTRTVEEAGCQDADSKMACLRDMSTKDLQKVNVPSPFPDRTDRPLFYWTPCVDGDFLEDGPTALFNAQSFVKVPLLFGTCTNEGSVFARDASSPDEVTSFILDNYPTMTSSQSSRLLDLYPREAELPDHNAYFPSASRAYGEATFICQTNHILNAFNSSNTTWSYRYNVQQTGSVERGLGVPHVAEIPAVMGPDMLSYSPDPSYTTYNADAVPLLMNYWLSFARTLNPNTERLDLSPEWDPWGRNQSRIVLQSQGSAMENVTDGERERCEFWRAIGSDINQ